MTTHFITAEIPVQPTVADLEAKIATALAAHGEPLRWAITRVEPQGLHIEAVVTQETVAP